LVLIADLHFALIRPSRKKAAVFVQEGYDPEAVIAEYRRTLPAGLEFESWKMMMPDLVQLIDLNYFSTTDILFSGCASGIGNFFQFDFGCMACVFGGS
jgi:hypothetical protein